MNIKEHKYHMAFFRSRRLNSLAVIIKESVFNNEIQNLSL